MMKGLFYTMTILFLVSCGGDDCELTQDILLPNDCSLTICDDMTHNILQGIDTSVGEIILNDSTNIFHYDIGWSEFLGPLTGTIIADNMGLTPFNYTLENNQYRFDFENSDTTNFKIKYRFISNYLDDEELLLDIMRTVEIPD